MKRFLAIAIASLAAGPVVAADLAVKAPPLAAPISVLDWTGTYVGAHGGYSWGDASYSFPAFLAANTAYQPVNGGAFTSGMSGGAIGYHSGFNVQSGHLVVGVEAAYTWTGLKSSTTSAFPAALVTPGATYSAKVNWLTTITPRLGYATGPWLAYVKGGLAAGEVDSTVTGALVPTILVHEKNRQLGWTAGAGVEYAVQNRWVVGLEYNYYDLGSERFGGSARQAGVPTDYGDYNVGVKASSVLARVSYRGGILETVLSASGPAPTPAWNWAGAYAGVHGGYGWGTSDYNFPPHSPTAGGAWSLPATGGAFDQKPDGGILGGHVGYNVQVGNWVFGPEASIAWSGLKSTSTDPLAASIGVNGTTYQTKLNWLATTTARLGYAPANWLIYAKGGLAAAQGESTLTFVANPPAFSFHERNAYVGWTVGAGVEYALNTNWIAGLEYNYVDLGTEHYGGNIPLGGGLIASQTDYEVGVKFSTILARISYKFGTPTVVAKY